MIPRSANSNLIFGFQALPLLFNREGGLANDGWLHIVPRGELLNKAAGVVQVLDDQALDAILANLRADAEKFGNRWPGLYMGEEHFIYDADKSSQAFVWAKEFEKRADGIWARGEVTDVGAPALQNKRFKFTSFVTDPSVPGSVEKLGGNRFRVLRIDTVGFTNQANGKHLLTPISNRKDFRTGTVPAPGAVRTQHKENSMEKIALLLGLAAAASEDAIAAQVGKLVNRGDISAADLATLQNRAQALEAENKTLLGEQVDALLDAHGVKEEKVRGHARAALLPLKNRADRVTWLTDMGHKPVEAGKAGKPGAVILNRGEGKLPGTPRVEGTEDGQIAEQQAAKLKNRADELKGAAPNRPFTDCWRQAQQELAAK